MLKNALDGCHVLVTRPRHQSQALCDLIEAAGGFAHRLPVMEIVDPEDSDKANDIIQRLDEFEIGVFISANAVERGYRLVAGQRNWPGTLRVAAVGKRTAEALVKLGLEVEICPQEDFSSETLLMHDALKHIKGKKIVIFRGEGGREILARKLRERGAIVEYAEVYRRLIPVNAGRDLRRLISQVPIDVILVTSNEGLKNLYQIAGGDYRGWLLEKKVVAISQRTASLAREMGFRYKAKIAEHTTDEGLVESVKAWCSQALVSGHTHE